MIRTNPAQDRDLAEAKATRERIYERDRKAVLAARASGLSLSKTAARAGVSVQRLRTILEKEKAGAA